MAITVNSHLKVTRKIEITTTKKRKTKQQRIPTTGPSTTEIKVRKEAKIMKRYNQVPHLTQDTAWESNKNTINITNKSNEVSPFSAGDHKAAMNRRKSTRETQDTKKHKWS